MNKMLIGASLFALTNLAFADGLFVTADLSSTRIAVDTGDGSEASKNTSGYDVGIGYHVTPNVSLELSYADFGTLNTSGSDGNGTLDTKSGITSTQASVLFNGNIGPKVKGYGRLGYSKSTLDVSYTYSWTDAYGSSSNSGSGSKDKSLWLVGAGVEYAINDSFSLRAEYDVYQKWSALKLSTIKGGIVYKM